MRVGPNISEKGLEDLVSNFLMLSGLVFVVLGFFGLFLMVFFPKMYGDDQVLEFGISFLYTYVMIMGIFLMAFHKKIFVKAFRT